MTTRETVAWTLPVNERLLKQRGNCWKKDSKGTLSGGVVRSLAEAYLVFEKRTWSEGVEISFVAQLPGVEGLQNWVLVVRSVNKETVLTISCDNYNSPWMYSLSKIDRNNIPSYFLPNEKIKGGPRFIAAMNLLNLVLDSLK